MSGNVGRAAETLDESGSAKLFEPRVNSVPRLGPALIDQRNRIVAPRILSRLRRFEEGAVRPGRLGVEIIQVYSLDRIGAFHSRFAGSAGPSRSPKPLAGVRVPVAVNYRAIDRASRIGFDCGPPAGPRFWSGGGAPR